MDHTKEEQVLPHMYKLQRSRGQIRSTGDGEFSCLIISDVHFVSSGLIVYLVITCMYYLPRKNCLQNPGIKAVEKLALNIYARVLAYISYLVVLWHLWL